MTTIRTDDPALDDALARISDLAGRLWAVRQAHSPVATRDETGRGRFGRGRFGRGRNVRGRFGRKRSGWERGRTGPVRCAGCGQASPCATLRAAG